MKFVRITRSVLLSLKEQGYNVLTSVNTVDDESPTYMPKQVDNVWEYLDNLQVDPMQEPALIVIDDVLSIDVDIPGVVWLNK